MFDTLLNANAGSTLGLAGTLTAINIIVVEVLKAILPKKIPTKIVTIISAMVIAISYMFIFDAISLQNGFIGIVSGFVIAFISMYGFDSLKDILNRFKVKDEGGEK